MDSENEKATTDNFQGLIHELQTWWCDYGCVVLQPYDMPMGAGTFHPATFLRATGQRQPWRAAYVQPVRRPADGRYGENPNRMQHYYQFQVVLKPSPTEVQEAFLDSLRYVGLDPLQHDIRFVEDNWESPTLGASGLGWEVWLDGMEICQFTYFQQMGGRECRPVTVELTYGLERIAMVLQEVENVYDLEWSEGVSYRELFQENEQQMSAYNFTPTENAVSIHSPEVTLAGMMNAFTANEQACIALLKDNLYLPAYDYLIQNSHLFNLLDARKTLSVSERQKYILRIRKMAQDVATQIVQAEEEEVAEKKKNQSSATTK